MLHFSYVFQILLLYFYLLVGIQIFYLQSSICLKIEHMISHCLSRMMSKQLLLPIHPTAFIFAMRVQPNVLEHRIRGNTAALSFTQLNVSKKPHKGGLNVSPQSSLKLKVSRSLLLLRSQHTKALDLRIDQRLRNTACLSIVSWQNSQLLFPFGNGLPMKAAATDKDSYQSKCQSMGPKSAYAAIA